MRDQRAPNCSHWHETLRRILVRAAAFVPSGLARSLACSIACGIVSVAAAHPPVTGDAPALATWGNQRTGESVVGSFLAARSGKVVIETASGDLATIPLVDLDPQARALAERRIAEIRRINDSLVAQAGAAPSARPGDPAAPARPKPPQAATFDAFAPFVSTRFDEQWLYVESDGLPHEPLPMTMMVGITAWQQQVPLPQAYVGPNAWQIPLHPTLAETPVSGRHALMRGAVALAANGVPIFNALNNRGDDAFAAGELDEFGGHSGRGDDYHYHAAPLGIERIVGKGKAIAYALDGFPIYGLFDPAAKAGEDKACPCGSHDPLDELNGHFCDVPRGEGIAGGTRSYHYHASRTFPYVNGGLRGRVTVEGSGNESQVVPQPHADPVRPALSPLRGARITGLEQTGPKAWALRYAIDGRTSVVRYRVDASGKVVFEFEGPDGAKRTEEYAPRRGGGVPPPPPEGRERGRGGRPRPEGAGPPRDEPAGAGRGSDRHDAPRQEGLTLTSAGIGADGQLDRRFTCDGESISPPFAWSGVPKEATSLALTIHHITPDDEERVYLVLSGVPASVASIAAGQTTVGRLGRNSVNREAGYAPPCSKGPGEKLYVATLYALSREPSFPAGTDPTREALLAAIKETTLATATLELRYARPDGATAEPPRRGGEEGRRGREGEGRSRRPKEGEGGGRNDARGLIARMTAFQTDVPRHPLDVVLLRPTDRSITLSAVVDEAATLEVESWPAGEPQRRHAASARAAAGTTTVVELDGLKADAAYRYRVGVRREGATDTTWSADAGFRTRRSAGAPFGFVVQADSHLDANMNVAAYEATLRAMREDAVAGRADFLVDLGDTFMTDKRGRDYERALPQYDAQRYYFGLACDAMPLFMVLGNHDGERGDAGAMATWSYRERVGRFPPPRTGDGMYTGATAFEGGRGAHHYAFEWGDALCIVLDPFWPTTERIRDSGGDGRGDNGGDNGGRGGGAGGGPGVGPLAPVDGGWSWTLGRDQYEWLASTLARTHAKQRFVFIHHLVGGLGGAAARGGVESAPYFEWGGGNPDGSPGFAERRPGWAMPIHRLLVQGGVTAVFHGHDHLYVHGTLDGVHYQCVPQPGNPAGGTRSAADYGYASGTILGSPGYLRVALDAAGAATIEYVRTGAAADGTSAPRVQDRYVIAPRVP